MNLNFSESTILDLSLKIKEKNVAPGENLFSKNDISDTFYIVL